MAEISIRYSAEDQVWAEWAVSVLRQAGVTVVDQGPRELAAPSARAETSLAVVSEAYVAAMERLGGTDHETPHLALYVSDAQLRKGPPRWSASVVGAPEDEAEQRLLRLVGYNGQERQLAEAGSHTRFPGEGPRWFNAPVRNARFTGRVEDLARVRAALTNTQKGLPVTLQGMAGVGKTQLALEYVHRFGAAYDLVWWIAADPPDFIDSALSDIGQTVKRLAPDVTAVEAAQLVLDMLRQGAIGRRWLLVFDNADDVARVERFLPRGGSAGHVLLTTRNPGWSEKTRPVDVGVFRRQDSVTHLKERSPAITQLEAEAVAQALGDLPIAVSAAGAWLAETGMAVADYLREIDRHGPSTVSVDPVESWDAPWELSLERLHQESPGAHRLLQLLSVLGPDVALPLIESERMAASLMAFDPSVSDRLMRGRLIQRINRLALLKVDPHARQVHIHRLVQDVVRRRMTDDEIAQARHEVHLTLARFRPRNEPDDPAGWPQFRMIWPHLEVSKAVSCRDESVRDLLIDRVRYLWTTGDHAPALTFGARIATAWENQLTEAPPDADTSPLRRQLLHLQFNVANVLRDLARYAEAYQLDEQVLAEQRKLLGERHANTLMTSSGLAADLRALGRYAEALRLEEQTQQVWHVDFGEIHPRTLAAGNNLATSLRAMGDFRRARAIDEEVADNRRQVLGPLHPLYLHSLAACGRDLRDAGEYKQSVQQLRDVLEVARKHLGEEHAVTLNAQASLAASLRSAGSPGDEAARLLDEAYAALSRRFGASSPGALACRLNRAANILALGDGEKALDEMTTVRDAYEQWLGMDHPFTMVCVSNQSAAYRATGNNETAASLAKRAAEGCGRLLGPRHPYHLAAAMNLLTCEYESEPDKKPTGDLADLATTMGTALGGRHPDVLVCRANLVVLEGSPVPPAATGPAVAGLGGDTRAALAARLGDEHPTVKAVKAGDPVQELTELLGEEHPTVRSLRRGAPHYRVLDLPDPF
jgi:tetratricopeptide (TPR) repeat protein